MYFWPTLQKNNFYTLADQCATSPEVQSPYKNIFVPTDQWNFGNFNLPNFFQGSEMINFELQKEKQVDFVDNYQNVKEKKAEKQKSIKKNEELQKGEDKKRNMKSIVAREFLKSVKDDRGSIFIAKKILNSQISLREFKNFILKKVPDEGKYIKFTTMKELCFNQAHKQESKLFRVLLKNFLKNQYPLLALGKKKNKNMESLSTARELQKKLFHPSLSQ